MGSAMDTSSRNTSGDHSAVMTPAIAELEVVRVTHDIEADGYSVRKDTCGTVVAVYDRGAAYAVEIADPPGGTEVVTLRADQIERIH
jgi:hypothetical protein